MKKTTLILSLIAYLASFVFSISVANEINIFSARHYDSDVQLYEKFTSKTGIKVNVVSGKSGALEKRIIEEQTNKKLTNNIDDLKDIEENLKDNLDKSINGFNQLNYKHKNLKLNFNALEENSLNKELKLPVYPSLPERTLSITLIRSMRLNS